MTFSFVFTFSSLWNFNSHACVGRDKKLVSTLTTSNHFNSHARVGRDFAGLASGNTHQISTHTPAWGVTNNTCKNAAVSGISTHTPAWGVTAKHLAGQFFDMIISTHTPAWGVTFSIRIRELIADYFNSHARVGRDTTSMTASAAKTDFNSHARVGRDKQERKCIVRGD